MEKSYDKYYVKRNPATSEVLINGNEPELGECAKKDCRLEPRHIKILNRGWANSGVYYVEVKEEVVESENNDQDARLALEIEAEALNITFRSNISDEKLQLKINEAKNK
jgi:hypothetical protein